MVSIYLRYWTIPTKADKSLVRLDSRLLRIVRPLHDKGEILYRSLPCVRRCEYEVNIRERNDVALVLQIAKKLFAKSRINAETGDLLPRIRVIFVGLQSVTNAVCAPKDRRVFMADLYQTMRCKCLGPMILFLHLPQGVRSIRVDQLQRDKAATIGRRQPANIAEHRTSC